MRRNVDISFLVTANSKPDALRITLGSLKLQKDIKSELIVSNNASNAATLSKISKVCAEFGAQCIVNSQPECYSATNLLSQYAIGRYVCFPSEEDYYTPIFGRQLLTHAKRFKLHLAYCDCLYDSRYTGSYEVMRVQPIIGHIDKGGFILRRNLFNGWPETPTTPCAAFCDGLLIENLRANGINYGKVCEVLWCHN